MITRIIVVATTFALAACSQEAATTAAASVDRPQEAISSVPASEAPLEVNRDLVAAQDKSVREAAAWTRKQCALTTPGDDRVLAAQRGAPIALSGFFIAPDDAPAGRFDIVLRGESDYRIPVRTGWSRPDVEEFFGIPGLAASGFQARVDLGGLPPGEYAVDFVVGRADGAYFCESGKILLLT